MNEYKYRDLLDQIASDLADYQNYESLDMEGEQVSQETFIRRVIASITEYETIREYE